MMRGTYRKTEHRRRDIVAAGLTVCRAGEGSTGLLRKTAAQAGLSEAGVLHHFAGVGDLLEAILDRHMAEILECAACDRVSGRAKLLCLSDLLDCSLRDPHLAHLYLTRTSEPGSTANNAQQASNAYTDALRECSRLGFKQCHDEGQLRSGADMDAAVESLISLVHGLQLRALREPDLNVRAVLETHIGTYLRDGPQMASAAG